MRKTTIILLLMASFVSLTHAQAPNWTVNSSDFENSMSVVAVAEIESAELQSTGSMIGAFVGSELRGVATTSFVNADNRFVAHVLIWSNLGGGETISFQIFDAQSNAVVESVNSISFQNDASIGNTADPFIVRDNNAPTGIALSASTIDENSLVDTEIGQFSSTDVDPGDTHTYGLVVGDGDDGNAHFSIDEDKLLLASIPDFEVENSLSIRVRTTDSKNGIFEESFTITISDVNDAPTDLSLSATAINENNAVGDAIGSLSTEDQDVDDTFDYVLVAGDGDTDNAAFSIAGSQLIANVPFNFEEQDTYSIRIETTDSGDETFEKQLSISINDINDRPTEIILSDTAIAENQGAGVLVGTFTSTDDDTANEHLYTFTGTGNNDNEDFAIVGNQLFTKVVFDFEGRRTYFINIQTDDQNGGLFSEIIDLAITNTNDPPTAVSMTDQLVAENMPAGIAVGDLETEDQDSNDSFTYRLVRGAGDDDNDLFDTVGDELRTEASLNFEEGSSYTIRIASRDSGGRTIESAFVIEVQDQNDNPTDIILDNNTTLENLSPGIIVGSLTTLDEDEGDDHFYTLVEGEGGDDNAAFAISDGRLITNTTFDFEAKSSFRVRVETNDRNDGLFQKAFEVAILDTNDDPTLLQLSSLTIAENQAVGTVVGSFSIVDEDPAGPAYSLIPGTNDNNLFKVEGSDLLTTEVFDYEMDAQYFIDVLGNDGSGGLVVNRFEITVQDTNDAPTALVLSVSTVAENSPLGIVVGQLSTEDQDVNDSHSYELIEGDGDTDNASFRIVGNELLTDDDFNFELRSSYEVRVKSTDGANASIEAQFDIQIIDVNDKPNDISLSNNQVAEELPTGSLIGELVIEDEDADDTFNIRLVGGIGGEDSDAFLIEGNQLLTNEVFDAETRTLYAIRVNVTDANSASISKNFVITVLPVNEPPQLEEQEFSVPERSAVGTSIGAMEASDIDGDALTFSLANVSTPFAIDETSGMLTVSSDDLDYEVSTLYELDVVVTDPEGLSSRSVATIFIEDVVELEEGLPVNDFVSPNNDGFNDFLEIQNVELYSDYTLRIFNNAGVEVYRSSAYRNTWNGVDDSGRELAVGAYYFTYSSSTSTVSFKGSITLVR
ncbi:MAG: cadherin domain-containing protein [Cyclobacteriaceae bacterium]